MEDEHTGATGVTAQGAHGEHQGAVLLHLAEVGTAVVQEHHGVVLPGEQAAPRLLVGDDVLQAEPPAGPPAHDGAEAHVGRARDVGRVEGEERAAVQHQAAGVVALQQLTQGRRVDAGDLHYDHSSGTTSAKRS